MADISDVDRVLISQLREAIEPELKLVPAYDDDYSLLRWIVGWDRKIDIIIPKIKASLRAVSALNLDRQDFSSIEKINAYCASVSKPLYYLPGSLLGYDKEHNIISLQMVGRLDVRGLMHCIRVSDLYVLRIAESEGKNEAMLGRQLGTTVIFDLEGLSMEMLWMPAIKVITTMLSHLQEMFPDVIRKLFIINSPTFFQLTWSLISPCLAKQTQQKVQILGSNWKEKLKECIDEDVLYKNWGGRRKADSPYGHIRIGGKVPAELRYDSSADIPKDSLSSILIPPRSTRCIPILFEDEDCNRKISWWWRASGGDLGFGILRSIDPSNKQTSDPEDHVIRPKFRLETEFVPEEGQVLCPAAGTYKVVFDNKHSLLRSKTVRYSINVSNDAN